MDNVSLVKSRLKLEHWRQLIDECQSSGMQVKQWCIQNNISKDQYYYWLRKVRETTVENLPVNAEMISVKESVTFKPLEVKAPSTGFAPSVTIHLPQATIEVPDGVSKSTVEAVLCALRKTC